MALLNSRLQKVIKSGQLKLHAHAPLCLKVLDFSFSPMNVPYNKIGGFIVPLASTMIGGANNPVANRMNRKLVHDEFRQLDGKYIRGIYIFSGWMCPGSVQLFWSQEFLVSSSPRCFEQSNFKICGDHYIQHP